MIHDEGLFSGSSGGGWSARGAPAQEDAPWSATQINFDTFGTADRIEDLAPLGAGILPSAVSAQMDTGISARGFSAMRTYVNGLPDIRRRYVRDLSSVSSIDILRGNATVAYGSGSPAGVLSYTLKPADGETRRLARWSVGNADTRRAEFDLGGRTEGGGTEYRVALAAQTGDTDFKNVGTDRAALYAAVAIAVGEAGRLIIDADTQRNERPYSFGTVLQNGIPVYGSGYAGPANQADRRYHRTALRYEHRFNARNMGHVALQNARVRRDEVMHGFYTKISESHLSGYYTAFDDRVQQNDVLAEWRGQRDWFGMHSDWRAGLSHGVARTGFGGIQNINGYQLAIDNPQFPQSPETLPMSPRFFRERHVEEALFVQSDWRLTPAWIIGAGLRRNLTEVDTDRSGRGLTPQARLRANTTSLQVLHKPLPGLSIWLNRGEGSEINTGYDRHGALLPHRETVQTELGVHWQPGTPGYLRTALYRLSQSHLPEIDPLDRTAQITRGLRQTTGIEFETAWPLGAWTFQANLNWLRPQLHDSGLDQMSVPAGIPRYLGALTAKHRWTTPQGTFNAGATLWGMGQRFANAANSQSVPGFGRLDLFAQWRQGKFALSATLANALDREYVEAMNSVADVYPGLSRRFVVMLEHGF